MKNPAVMENPVVMKNLADMKDPAVILRLRSKDKGGRRPRVIVKEHGCTLNKYARVGNHRVVG